MENHNLIEKKKPIFSIIKEKSMVKIQKSRMEIIVEKNATINLVFKKMNKNDNNLESIMFIHFHENPTPLKIHSWEDYDDKTFEFIEKQYKLKIKSIYVDTREKSKLDIIFLDEINLFKEYLLDLLNNNYSSSIYNFDYFKKKFPNKWDYYECIIVMVLYNKIKFDDMNNVLLYLYDNLKKMKESNTNELLKKKLIDYVKHDLSELIKEIFNF